MSVADLARSRRARQAAAASLPATTRKSCSKRRSAARAARSSSGRDAATRPTPLKADDSEEPLRRTPGEHKVDARAEGRAGTRSDPDATAASEDESRAQPRGGALRAGRGALALTGSEADDGEKRGRARKALEADDGEEDASRRGAPSESESLGKNDRPRARRPRLSRTRSDRVRDASREERRSVRSGERGDESGSKRRAAARAARSSIGRDAAPLPTPRGADDSEELLREAPGEDIVDARAGGRAKTRASPDAAAASEPCREPCWEPKP